MNDDERPARGWTAGAGRPGLSGPLGVAVLALVAVALLAAIAIQLASTPAPASPTASTCGSGPVATCPSPTATGLPSPSPTSSPGASPTVAGPTPIPAPTFTTHVVQPGESLGTIARDFRTTARSIAWWNRGTYPSLDPQSVNYDPNHIEVGWSLVLMPGVIVDDANPPSPSPGPPTASPGASTSPPTATPTDGPSPSA